MSSSLDFTRNFEDQIIERLNAIFQNIQVPLKAWSQQQLELEKSRWGTVDIVIGHKDEIRTKSFSKLVVIENEVVSNKNQIWKNFNDFRDWVELSENRKGGLLHIFAEDAGFKLFDRVEMLKAAFNARSKSSLFLYESYDYVPINQSWDTYEETANELLKDWGFKVKIWAMISEIFDINNLILKKTLQ